MRADRDAGNDPATDKRTARAVAAKPAAVGYTVRALCNDFMTGYVDINRQPKGAKEARRLFDKYLGDFADAQAVDTTRKTAFAVIEAMASTPVQAKSLKADLGAAWDYALDAGKLPDNAANWWRLIMRGKLRSKGRMVQGESDGGVKRFFTGQEAGTVINWLPNFSRNVCDVLTLYFWTCCRGVEICAMEKSEIHEEADGLWWVIPKAKTKNARYSSATDQRVPLIGRAESVVRRRMLLTNGFIFLSPGKLGHIEQKAIQTTVWIHQPYSKTRPEEARARLTVTHWSPHDVRRTGRTFLASLGCPEEVAEAILGHLPPGIVGVYNMYKYDAERRLWLTRLSDHLELLASKA